MSSHDQERQRRTVARFAALVFNLRDSASELLRPGIVDMLSAPERALAEGVIDACKRWDAALAAETER